MPLPIRPNKKEDYENELKESHKYETLIRSVNQIDRAGIRSALIRRLNDEKLKENAAAAAENSLQTSQTKENEEIKKLAIDLDYQTQIIKREEKQRQQIRQNNEELLQLQRQLRAAYVGKGLRAQLAENEAQKLQEKVDVQKEQENMLALRLADEQYHRTKKQQQKDDQLKFRNELQEQMANNRRRMQILYQEFLNEKKHIDDMIQRVQDEEMREIQYKFQKKEKFTSDLIELSNFRKMKKEKEQQELNAENIRIAQFLKEQERTQDEKKRIEEEKKKASSGCSERLGAELIAIEEKKRKREELLLSLQIEEIEEKFEQQTRENLEKQFRHRLNVRKQIERQHADNLEKEKYEQLVDKEFRQNQMEYLAERDKIDQLTTEKKRQKIWEHNRIVREILDRKKQEKMQRTQRVIDEYKTEQAETQRMQEIIEEERIKLLKEHAAELIGFFPPGVLRQSDRAALNI